MDELIAQLSQAALAQQMGGADYANQLSATQTANLPRRFTPGARIPERFVPPVRPSEELQRELLQTRQANALAQRMMNM